MPKFTIKNKHGQNIVGIIDGLESGKLKPVVILLHGFKGFMAQLHLEYPAKKLARNGFAAVRFDTANGIGESDGDIFDCTTSGYLDDVNAVFDYVSDLDGIDQNRIGLLGASWGGMVAILFSSANDKIRTLVLHEPSFNWKRENMNKNPAEWQRQGYKMILSKSLNKEVKVGYGFYADGLKYDNVAAAHKIKCPVLVIQGEGGGDNTAMASTQELINALHTKKELKIISGAPHSPKEKQHLEQISKIVIGWVKKYLS